MDTVILVFSALFGAAIGSFLNVCIFRLPRQCLRIWRPKISFCPGCHRTLEWFENLPLVSFLALGGRCRTCKNPIPLRYFLVELTTALAFVYLAHRDVGSGGPRLWATFVGHAVFVAALLVCALVDWDHKVIPDEIDIPGFLLAPFVAYTVVAIDGADTWTLSRVLSEDGTEVKLGPIDFAGLSAQIRDALSSALPWWGASGGVVAIVKRPFDFLATHLDSPPLQAALVSLFGVCVGAAAIYAIGWIGDRAFTSKEGAMGFGDVKFMAMVGGLVGWQGVIMTIVVGAIVGAVWGIAFKIKGGRNTVLGKDLLEVTGLGYLALRIFGAPKEAPPEVPVRLRWGGWLAARLATGEAYLPFGPFLAMGAVLSLFWPGTLVTLWERWGSLIRR